MCLLEQHLSIAVMQMGTSSFAASHISHCAPERAGIPASVRGCAVAPTKGLLALNVPPAAVQTNDSASPQESSVRTEQGPAVPAPAVCRRGSQNAHDLHQRKPQIAAKDSAQQPRVEIQATSHAVAVSKVPLVKAAQAASTSLAWSKAGAKAAFDASTLELGGKKVCLLAAPSHCRLSTES